MYYTVWPSPLGDLRLVFDDDALHEASFAGQRHEVPLDPGWTRHDDHPLVRRAIAQFAAYFAGAARRFDLPLALDGTAFQRRVWRALLDIGWGRTASYGEIARAIGAPAAVRAVGAAVGRNPLSVVVPCHRVVGSDGSLTGYAGGLDRKHRLLAIEGWSVPGDDPRDRPVRPVPATAS
jgi:methylated-DNA-[protein]-cysteine S-methyltransferase